MKFTTNTAASVAASILAFTPAVVAKDSRTFAVLRFTNKELTKGRMDPIVSPGQTSAHVHSIMGGSNFGLGSTGEDLKDSQCSNAMIKGDNSNYWYPALYFKDPETGKLEDVEPFYTNAYYFFEATNDEIKAFPTGLQMVSGDAMSRSVPNTDGRTILDPSQGTVQPVKFTCPRSNYDSPAWPLGSDGSEAGIQDPNNQGEGVGFPDVNCDGFGSPLRADVHFPSCYNPDAGLTDYQNNMAFPEDNGGKQDCPKGWIHVPHLFIEVYWNTPLFQDRWTPGQGEQPFVFANGDVTGFSSHADFMAGWDEELLQHIIDTCDAGSSGMDKCPGLFYGLNDEDCTIEPASNEKVNGVMSALPGNNPLAGWSYGTPDNGGSQPDPVPSPSPSPKPTSEPATVPEAPTTAEEGLPEETEPVTTIAGNPGVPTTESSAEAAPTTTVEAEEPAEPAPTPTATAEPEEPAEPVPTATAEPEEPEEPTPTELTTSAAQCTPKTKTVWATVTVTAPPPSETGGAGNSTEGVAGFQYAGCFKDSQDRVLTGAIRPNLGKVSNENCVAHCKKAGFALAGTEYGGQCYCGDELVGSEQIEDADCDMVCEGDSASMCGGSWALSVYSADGEASMKSAKARRHAHEHVHEHLHRHRSFRR